MEPSGTPKGHLEREKRKWNHLERPQGTWNARRASIMNEGEETSGDVLAEEHEFPAFGRMELEGI